MDKDTKNTLHPNKRIPEKSPTLMESFGLNTRVIVLATFVVVFLGITFSVGAHLMFVGDSSSQALKNSENPVNPEFLDRHVEHLVHLHFFYQPDSNDFPRYWQRNIMDKMDPKFFNSQPSVKTLDNYCSPESIQYLQNIADHKQATEKHDVPFKNFPPEPQVICPNFDHFTVINSDYAIVSKNDQPKSLYTEDPSDRLVSAFIRKGWKVNYLPNGYRNEITQDCFRLVKNKPRLLHNLLKINHDISKVTIGLTTKGLPSKCRRPLHEIRQDNTRKTSIRHTHSLFQPKTRLWRTFNQYPKNATNNCSVLQNKLPTTYSLNYYSDCRLFFDKIKRYEQEGTLRHWVYKAVNDPVTVFDGEILVMLRKMRKENGVCKFDGVMVQENVRNLIKLHGNGVLVRSYLYVVASEPSFVAYVGSYHACFMTVRLPERGDVAGGFKEGGKKMEMPCDELERLVYEEGTVRSPFWFSENVITKVKQVLAHIARVEREGSVGEGRTFRMFSVDFLVTEDFDVQVIEVESLPDLHGNLSYGQIKDHDTFVELLGQNLLEGKATTEELKRYDWGPLYDSSKSIPERYFGNLPEGCWNFDRE